jgi:hypothetical protein
MTRKSHEQVIWEYEDKNVNNITKLVAALHNGDVTVVPIKMPTNSQSTKDERIQAYRDIRAYIENWIDKQPMKNDGYLRLRIVKGMELVLPHHDWRQYGDTKQKTHMVMHWGVETSYLLFRDKEDAVLFKAQLDPKYM